MNMYFNSIFKGRQIFRTTRTKTIQPSVVREAARGPTQLAEAGLELRAGVERLHLLVKRADGERRF